MDFVITITVGKTPEGYVTAEVKSAPDLPPLDSDPQVFMANYMIEAVATAMKNFQESVQGVHWMKDDSKRY